MAVRNRARSKDEFIYLINQALDEIFDLRAAIEYDEEFMGDAAQIVEPLNNGLSRLLSTVKCAAYQPGEGDYLDFLHILKNTDQRAIPFWTVLKLILDTHTNGYQEK
ncbi:MAG: hypothetical protein H8E21_07990 [Gammaproteobacteria bacterium]|nr:hypothetical protein [Gammaproteobacteria bacterium]